MKIVSFSIFSFKWHNLKVYVQFKTLTKTCFNLILNNGEIVKMPNLAKLVEHFECQVVNKNSERTVLSNHKRLKRGFIFLIQPHLLIGGPYHRYTKCNASPGDCVCVCRYYISKGAIVDQLGGDLNSTPLHWATRWHADICYSVAWNHPQISVFMFRHYVLIRKWLNLTDTF